MADHELISPLYCAERNVCSSLLLYPEHNCHIHEQHTSHDFHVGLQISKLFCLLLYDT